MILISPDGLGINRSMCADNRIERAKIHFISMLKIYSMAWYYDLYSTYYFISFMPHLCILLKIRLRLILCSHSRTLHTVFKPLFKNFSHNFFNIQSILLFNCVLFKADSFIVYCTDKQWSAVSIRAPESWEQFN